jgi:hypothetical protein
MCIDYTNLNNASPKHPFLLPQIDQIMDSTSGCDVLCFLDVYSGFHQIPMSREDEEHTAFIILDGLFCYVSIPYGLKNALPTFVCVMRKTFGDLIRDFVEVYVDDTIVKIKSRASLLDNLALVFDRLLSMCMLAIIKCIYLPLTYLHFIQHIEDRCLLLMSSTSFIDPPFQEHRMMKKHHMDQNQCISSLCPK